MKITSSYAVELFHANEILRPTVEIYRAALDYLIDAVDSEWTSLSDLGALERFNAAERMVHGTKGSKAKYNFDQTFPKMPAYLRRAALQSAIGAVSSHRSHLAMYEEDGQTGKRPRLPNQPQMMPTLGAVHSA